MDLKQQFIFWYFNEFQTTPLYHAMAQLAEESPHHRERSIATHNDMVVTQYISSIRYRWHLPDLCGAFAAAFHDVGKPEAMEIAYKEERGEYKKFFGHELTSARMWEDWAVKNWASLVRLGLEPVHIYHIAWMIENHLPWKLKDKEKLRRLALTASVVNIDAYTRFLLADGAGRICDSDKVGESEKWCYNFSHFSAELQFQEEVHSLTDPTPEKQPVLIMPIGPSGVGKTTLYRRLLTQYDSLYPYSWDELRLLWYLDGSEIEQMPTNAKEMYRLAFQRQLEDSNFNQKANKEFIDLVQQQANIFVDNTNTSKKRRRFFTDEARRHGYKLIAYLMPIDLDTLKSRQRTRTDKEVPDNAVERHYLNTQMPNYGEFDEIIVEGGNLPV